MGVNQSCVYSIRWITSQNDKDATAKRHLILTAATHPHLPHRSYITESCFGVSVSSKTGTGQTNLNINSLTVSAVKIHLIISAVFAVAVSGTICVSYAQSNPISLHSDKDLYIAGEFIIISGEVMTVLPGEHARLQVQRNTDGFLIEVAQFDVAQDGTYTYIVNTDGPSWEEDGKYTIRMWYGSESNTISIDFVTETATNMINYEVPDGRGGTFDLKYSIYGADVQSMFINYENLSLEIEIDAQKDGKIYLDLPRRYINSSVDDVDIDYITLVDERSVSHTEESNSETRLVTVAFPEGAKLISVIGTAVVPEFGLVILLLAAALLFPIVLLRGYITHRTAP